MKKISIALLGLLTTLTLFGKEPPKELYDNLKVDKVNNLTKLNKSEENKLLSTNSGYLRDLQIELFKLSKANMIGYAKINFIIDTKQGKIVKFLILEKRGTEEFNSGLRDMLEKSYNIKLKKENFPDPIIEVSIAIGDKNYTAKPNENWSMLATKTNLYREYLEYVIKTKGISKQEVKKALNSEKNSLLKSTLYAIYYDFEKSDPKSAKEYYEYIINNELDSIVQTKEAFIAADYLLLQNRYKEILQILPERSCPLFKDEDKYTCYYYQAFAQYKLGKDYELSLNIAKNHSIMGEKLANKIKSERGKKQ